VTLMGSRAPRVTHLHRCSIKVEEINIIVLQLYVTNRTLKQLVCLFVCLLLNDTAALFRLLVQD